MLHRYQLIKKEKKADAYSALEVYRATQKARAAAKSKKNRRHEVSTATCQATKAGEKISRFFVHVQTTGEQTFLSRACFMHNFMHDPASHLQKPAIFAAILCGRSP